MTAPRQVLPGSTYLVTRRCAQRQFLLRPSASTNATFLFVLAVAAERFGVLVHAFCVMSNHVHLVVTDPYARLPAFNQFLDALVARAVNASLGRWETFWAPSSYSAVRLVSREDIVEKTAYALANPVAAGLVRVGRTWPGAWSDPDRIGAGPIHIPRPQQFFSATGSLPAKAELELTTPPGFESAATFRDEVLTAVAAREREEQQKVGDGFLGAVRVLKQSPFSRPRSFAPRRNLGPRVASKDKWKRIEALTALKEFVQEYRAALAARRAGRSASVFPPGTYLMRVMHGVPCVGFG